MLAKLRQSESTLKMRGTLALLVLKRHGLYLSGHWLFSS